MNKQEITSKIKEITETGAVCGVDVYVCLKGEEQGFYIEKMISMNSLKDRIRSIASELIVTPVTPQIEEKSLNKVAEAAAAARLAQGAEGVVCGLPRNMDGTEGSRCVKSRRFAARLATACGVPVVLWDERRTTVTAAGILSANSTFGADRKARLDSVSAAVILESFLAWRKAHPGEEPPEVAAPTAPEQA